MAFGPAILARNDGESGGRLGEHSAPSHAFQVLTPEQDHFARCMGEELLELLRVANTPDGLRLAFVSWIIANLASHEFIEIIPIEGRTLRARATPAGREALALRPCIDPPSLGSQIH